MRMTMITSTEGQLSRCCVKFHNSVQQWKRISVRGLNELQTISQAKFSIDRKEAVGKLLLVELELCGVVEMLNKLCVNIKATSELMCNDDIITPMTIYAHCCTIQRSYSEELSVRRKIVQEVMAAGEMKTCYSSTWLHEPFISCSNCDELLHSVLVLSGNKST
ncbi:uncharacterized protein [Dysidea avara]|uniref:uncharacterized protein n=1 Tax=Dysidea avara TaxID=196820 RepID=UPI003317D3D8